VKSTEPLSDGSPDANAILETLQAYESARIRPIRGFLRRRGVSIHFADKPEGIRLFGSPYAALNRLISKKLNLHDHERSIGNRSPEYFFPEGQLLRTRESAERIAGGLEELLAGRRAANSKRYHSARPLVVLAWPDLHSGDSDRSPPALVGEVHGDPRSGGQGIGNSDRGLAGPAPGRGPQGSKSAQPSLGRDHASGASGAAAPAGIAPTVVMIDRAGAGVSNYPPGPGPAMPDTSTENDPDEQSNAFRKYPPSNEKNHETDTEDQSTETGRDPELPGTSHTYNGATDTKFDYTYNSLNQMQTSAQSGNVFLDYGASTGYTYGYDGMGEVTSAVASLNGSAMPGRIYSYSYDSAGNRLSADHTGGVQGLAETYSPNWSNQVTAREHTTVPVQGNALTGANVVVQSTLASRAGNYWASEALLANASGPAYGSISVYAGEAGAGSGGTDLVSQNNIMAFLLPFSETITYDLDGDLLTDGQWGYTWDAEHRLIGMVTNTTAQGAGLAKTQLSFAYDYLGRRFSKTVTVGSGQPTVSQYVYIGWNVAAELDGSGNLKRQFIWGLDRSGTTSGLGGVGGLLMIQDSGNDYFPAYDGGANVAALLQASNGAIVASYEYSPFGELLRKQGSYAISNPFRFSTKWWDEETGFSYYGLRYYSSSLGRFISRDPIEEKGGLNLYAFCGNSPMNGFDMLGMADPTSGSGWNALGQEWNTPSDPKDAAASNNLLSYTQIVGGDYVDNDLNPCGLEGPIIQNATNTAAPTGYTSTDVNAMEAEASNPLTISVPSGDPMDDNSGSVMSGPAPAVGSTAADQSFQLNIPSGSLSLDPTYIENINVAPNSAGMVAAAGMVTTVPGILPTTTGGVSTIGGWLARAGAWVTDALDTTVLGPLGAILLLTPTPMGNDEIQPTFDQSTFNLPNSVDASRTPATGVPNSVVTFPDGTTRVYGPDGNAILDIDTGHDHGAGDPHAHDWDWNQTPPRQPGRPLNPGEGQTGPSNQTPGS